MKISYFRNLMATAEFVFRLTEYKLRGLPFVGLPVLIRLPRIPTSAEYAVFTTAVVEAALDLQDTLCKPPAIAATSKKGSRLSN